MACRHILLLNPGGEGYSRKTRSASDITAPLGRADQTEKLVPQPQEDCAFGLLILNEAPMRSSTKSISAPRRKSSDIESISTTAPSRSSTRSSSAFTSSNAKLY